MDVWRELDALVAEKVMGMGNQMTVARQPDGSFVPTGEVWYDCPEFSTDMEVAWWIVERMTDHLRVDWCTFEMRKITDWEDPTWGYDVFFGRQYDSTRQPDRVAWARTAPEAICLAALKAVGVDAPKLRA